MSIIMEVVHDLKLRTPTEFDDYSRIYGESVLPLMQACGFGLLGWFQWRSGGLGRDLVLAEFDSLEAHTQAREKLGPKVATGAINDLMALNLDMREHICTATILPFTSPESRQELLLGSGATPRQYLYARIRPVMTGVEQALSDVKRVARDLDGTGLKLATAYMPDSGWKWEIVTVWAVDAASDEPAGTPAAVWAAVDQLRDALPNLSIDYLSPLKQSPLQ